MNIINKYTDLILCFSEMETDKSKSEANGSDEPDVFSFSNNDASNKNEAKSPVAKESLFYNMNHKSRGLAIIFNHEKFDSDSLKQRNGTNVDADNLKNTLTRLGFSVAVFKDYLCHQVENVLIEASKEDHSDFDCFVVAVLSHGEHGIIYAKDHAYKPEILWTKFSADNCKTLAGKPKLFFIQACQGDKLDGGIKMTQTDSSSTYKIPVHADFLIAYSTIPQYYSWRNTARGSWFVQALCSVLDEIGTDYDILTLLTLVNQRVAFDFESYVPNDSRMHAQKQIPCITFMLTRLLKFNIKTQPMPT
ncbi:caspase-1 isoform X2 [Nilaparvata lugens]|uniref:caspase-1 isoform X2 n=1 Tax=Nilaparvata lugens TaxID=108931 RepID=UPI00193DA051|nr:caspase-1 isoform X2 [Nilaparvata lugens]